MRNGKLAILLLATILTTGCTTMRGQADAAYARRDYLGAIEIYDKILAGDPNDGDAHVKRANARNALIQKLLVTAQQARGTGREVDAVTAIDQLLTHRDAWNIKVEPQLAAPLATEVAVAGQFVANEVARRTKTAGPLAAEHQEQLFASLFTHPELTAVGADVRAKVADAGHASCDALAADASSPYWAWLVAAYCTHFGTPRPAPVLPNLYGGIDVDGAISGEDAVETGALRAALAAAFDDSVWFRAAAPAKAHANTDGAIAASFASHPIQLTANWTESVAYTDTETQQEEYQEPYDDTEFYTESVPHTEYTTTTDPCGETTCTNTTPTTVYTEETKTRTVTKYRSAYRTIVVPVTKYRDEPRSFTYDATKRTAAYSSRLHVSVAGPNVEAVVTSLFSDEGVDTDASNDAAGVAPSRASLMTLDGFAKREADRLRDDLHARLDATYAARYCSAATYDREQAAACAYLDPKQLPPAARQALRPIFGGDEPFLASVLVR